MDSLQSIKDAVCEEFGITPAHIAGRCRSALYSPPRQAAWWLARELTGHSLPVIGRCIGKRDHTTVLHGLGAHERRMLDDPAYRAKCMRLRSRLGHLTDKPDHTNEAIAEMISSGPLKPTEMRVADFVRALRVMGKRIEIVDIDRGAA
jgi:hypothetical protein